MIKLTTISVTALRDNRVVNQIGFFPPKHSERTFIAELDFNNCPSVDYFLFFIDFLNEVFIL